MNDSAEGSKTIRRELFTGGGAKPVRGTCMKTDIKVEVDRLAADPRITDYDFWRSLKNVDNEIFHIANNNEPIPFDMIRWRSILKRARLKRGHA
ncbi:Uncharacterized protein MLTONO_1261 [Mesorhizobium loti]|nr:Uncharacterized protein MLTONO_1261 [Mesorhizobium loti]